MRAVHAVDVDVDAYEDILATFEVHNVRKQSNDIVSRLICMLIVTTQDGTRHRVSGVCTSIQTI